MLTSVDQTIIQLLRTVELACRQSAGSPDPASAIADALSDARARFTQIVDNA